MKLIKQALYLITLIYIFSGCSSGGDIQSKTNNTTTNYAHNIIVVSDLSNRIINERKLNDPQIVQTITSDLPSLFQKSIDVEMNDKFYLTTINDNDIADSVSTSVFQIDLTKFKQDAVKRSDYLYHNKGDNSFSYDAEKLNSTFNKVYEFKKTSKQLPADVWYYFQDKLSFPLLDTSTFETNYDEVHLIDKYKNYLILLTDGYIEADRYGNNSEMQQKNKTRYLSQSWIEEFRNKYKQSGESDMNAFFEKNEYGIMPVQNPLLKDCKILVLEMYDRSVKNGITTKTPTDFEIMKLFWRDWLEKSGIPSSNIILKPCYSNIQDLNKELKQFFEDSN